ncbi:MAG: DUF4290 domain-containing protein [Bacteroidales bacterium]|nr:DUF4290 domain-containing protein [Bacteroidales bacterium]
MEYISNPTLRFPEYGRNIQLLIDYTVRLEDPDDQEKSAKAIITTMGNLTPQIKENPDYKHILWDHLSIMSDYKLAKYSPYGAPDPELTDSKPEPIIPDTDPMKHPTFGRIIERLIEKCKTIEDLDRRNVLIETITNHMKKSYVVWNKEDINDEVIFKVLKEITEGELEVTDENLKLINAHDFMKSKYKLNQQNNYRNQMNNNRGRFNNNNNQNQNRRYYK